jgi:hypothetical protein
MDPTIDVAKIMKKPFSHKSQMVSIAELLEAMCDQGGVDYFLCNGVLFMSTPEKVKSYYTRGIDAWVKSKRKVFPRFGMHYDTSYREGADPEWREKYAERLNASPQVVDPGREIDVKDYINKTIGTGLNLTVTWDADAEKKLTEASKTVRIKTTPVTKAQLLALLLMPFDLGFILKDEAIHVVTNATADKAWVDRLGSPGKGPADNGGKEPDPNQLPDPTAEIMNEVVAHWLDESKKDTWGNVLFYVESKRIDTLKFLINIMNDKSGYEKFRVRILVNHVFHAGLPRPITQGYLPALDEKTSVDFSETFQEAFDMINSDEFKSLSITLDPSLTNRKEILAKSFGLKNDDIRLAEVIEEMCAQAKLDWIFVYGVIYMSTPEKIEWFYNQGLADWNSQAAERNKKYPPRFGLHFDHSVLKGDPEWREGIFKDVLDARPRPFTPSKPISVQTFVEETLVGRMELPIAWEEGFWESFPEEAKSVQMYTTPVQLSQLLGLLLMPFDKGWIVKDEKVYLVDRKECETYWVERFKDLYKSGE